MCTNMQRENKCTSLRCFGVYTYRYECMLTTELCLPLNPYSYKVGSSIQNIRADADVIDELQEKLEPHKRNW